jgi:hypothetical protein
METNLLMQGVGCGGRRALAALLFALTAVPGIAHAETGIERMEIYPLSRDPVPLTIAAERQGDDVIVRATLRFANECLAATGFDAIDHALEPMRLTGSHLVMLRARVAKDGCPDMYAPVEQAAVLRIRQAREVRQVVLLDEIAGRHPAVAVVTPSAGDATGAVPAVPGPALLPLAAASFTPALDLRMRIRVPDDCVARDFRIEIVEGRSATASGQSVPLVPLWVLIIGDHPRCGSSGADKEIDVQASLRSIILQGRELWLVNALLAPDTGTPRIFTPLAAGR